MQTRPRFLLLTFAAVALVATGCSRYSDFVAEPTDGDNPARGNVAAGAVAMRTTFSGAMTGPFDGHPPTGRSMKVAFQLFGHVRNGRLCELWEEYDVAGMRRQLGIDPQTGALKASESGLSARGL